ncbi:amidohydrolase family protein [Jiangella anatolica]|uniref:Amidohydrolase n=1 Tax=Jiangella anatolica TaxID=2670374 RepID=A0A2W2C8T3_9ACTN|nr:amidohydrolase family protein [Jiangella anatolica]PZF82186.1 amidohydrolase [Jiangella anatolica]
MIVDAHHHLWRDAGRGYRWLEGPAMAALRRPFWVPELRTVLASSDVERTVLVESGLGREIEVEEFLAVAEKTPEIGGVVGWIDPARPDLADALARYRSLPGGRFLSGVRAHATHSPDADYFDRPEVRRGLAAVGAAGLTFDLVVRHDQLPAAARAVAALPEVTFVLDHLALPPLDGGAAGLARWRSLVAPLAASPNAVAKVSGLVTLPGATVAAAAPFVAAAVELFGPDRLMLAADWPNCLRMADYAQTWRFHEAALPALSPAELAALRGGSAVRVYGLT